MIQQESNFEKVSKIALEREIGIPAGQKIQLTDTSPYAELEATTIEKAKQEKRTGQPSGLISVHAASDSPVAADAGRGQARTPAQPQLRRFAGNGSSGGITGSVYHGVFTAQGELEVPLFHEAAKFRGDRQTADAQLFASLLPQMADLKSKTATSTCGDEPA